MSSLWWLYTIVLGDAFATVARSLATSLKHRRVSPDSRLFLPALTWQIFLMILIVEVWVALTYYLRTLTSISIFSMLAFLAIPIGIFIMASVLNNAVKKDTEPNEEMIFARSRPLFFGVLIAIPAINIVHEAILGNAGLDSDLLFQVLIIVGGVVGLFIRKRNADLVLAVIMSLVVLTYILVDYSTVTIV